MELSNLSIKILSDYISLIDEINELENNSLEQFLKGYVPLSENTDFNSLQWLISDRADTKISDEERRDIHRIITILGEIDSAINEYLNNSNIDILKGILKIVRNFYGLTSIKQNIL